MSGIPCPGCGITRSLVCCGHGELLRALVLHPLGPLCFVLLIGATVLRFFPDYKFPERSVRLASFALLIALLGFWIVRLLGWLPKPP